MKNYEYFKLLAKTVMILLRVLDIFPRSWLVKFGYSKIGSKIVQRVKQNQANRWFDINGVKMYLDITNPHTWDLRNNKNYEDNVKKIFLSKINEGDTVIDVGANIGFFSLLAAMKIGSKGKIFAIEPMEQANTWLKKNFKLNDFKNDEVLEVAIGDKQGTMKMYKKTELSEMIVLDPAISKKDLIICGEINIETIDNIISKKKIEKVNLLKIDVEGFEYEVLLGCKESFKANKIENIICEIHTKYLKNRGIEEQNIYSFLKESNFSIQEINTPEETKHILATLSPHLQIT